MSFKVDFRVVEEIVASIRGFISSHGAELFYKNCLKAVSCLFDHLADVRWEREALRCSLWFSYGGLSILERHLVNTSLYSLILAREIGLDKRDVILTALSAALHDVGKIYTPFHSLPRGLTLIEKMLIMRHPEYGFDMVIQHSEEVGLGVLYHHECEDGSGYPYGCCGRELHISAKIIHVCDVYEALTSRRPYRVPMSPEDALEFMSSSREKRKFDREILKEFTGLLRSKASHFNAGIQRHPRIPIRE